MVLPGSWNSIFTGLFSTLVTINHRRFIILAIVYNDYTCTPAVNNIFCKIQLMYLKVADNPMDEF